MKLWTGLSMGFSDIWNPNNGIGHKNSLNRRYLSKNIFCQASAAVTLCTYSHFEGIILGKTGINMQTGASINGRMPAQTAHTLQMNTVVRPN